MSSASVQDHFVMPSHKSHGSETTSLQSCNWTVVTALYDIRREGFDGRSFEQYQRWFMDTLSSVDDPMVVFVRGSEVELVRKARGMNPLRIIVEEEYPLQWAEPTVEKILKDPLWIEKLKYPQDIGNRLTAYTTLQHSKFPWLVRAIEENPFGTTHFTWIDGGLSRLFLAAETQAVPERKCHEELQIIKGNLGDLWDSEERKKWTVEKAIGSSNNFFRGGFFGGSKSAVLSVSQKMLFCFFFDMLAKGRVDNEQITFWLVFLKAPELFRVFEPKQQDDPFAWTKTVLKWSGSAHYE